MVVSGLDFKEGCALDCVQAQDAGGNYHRDLLSLHVDHRHRGLVSHHEEGAAVEVVMRHCLDTTVLGKAR